MKKEKKKKTVKKERKVKINKSVKYLFFIVIGIAVMTVVIKKAYQMELLPLDARENSEVELTEVYPLKTKDIKQAEKSDIDKEKTLDLSLVNRYLEISNGYQIEITGEIEVSGQVKNAWSVTPDLENNEGSSDLLNVVLQKSGEYVGIGTLEVYSNMINGVNQYKSISSGEFFKAFPQETIGEVQHGFILDYTVPEISKGNAPLPLKYLYGYYIFKNGAGILIQLNLTDDTCYTQLKEDMTDEQFKEQFKEEIDLYNKTYKFTKMKK